MLSCPGGRPPHILPDESARGLFRRAQTVEIPLSRTEVGAVEEASLGETRTNASPSWGFSSGLSLICAGDPREVRALVLVIVDPLLWVLGYNTAFFLR